MFKVKLPAELTILKMMKYESRYEEYESIDAKEVIEEWLTKTAEVNPEAVRILTRQIDQIKGKK